MANELDVLIIGGGLSGLTSAYVCQTLGYTPTILERTPRLGGGSQSFHDSDGHIYDYGYHALDDGRSEVTTRFFKKMLHGKFLRHQLRRALVLESSIIPYNAPLTEWPKSFSHLFSDKDFRDASSENPNTSELANVYGKKFLEYVENEILPSYPSKRWCLENGAKLEDHLGYVYPWFFPRATRERKRTDEWNAYHDRMRETQPHVLYPQHGGFEEFAKGIEAHVRSGPHQIFTNCGTLTPIRSPKSDRCVGFSTPEQEFRSSNIFWCAPMPALLATFGRKVSIDGKRQKIVMGNFAFKRDLSSDLHEILVGSKAHLINRISFPGKLQSREHRTLQVEFYYPENEYNLTEAEWRTSWLNSLQELHLIPNEPEAQFSFLQDFRGFVTKERFEVLAKHMREEIHSLQTGLNIPFPMIGPENINRLIPETIRNTTQALTV